MKVNKFLKTSIITLIIIAISIISFLGMYVEDKNTMKNLVPEYKLGRDLKGSRVVELEVSDEVTKINYDENGNVIEASDTETKVANTVEKKANENEVLTLENYENSKKIIEKRLSEMNIKDYAISQNTENGKMVVEIPEDDITDSVVYELMYQGKFEIVDKDTSEVLMANDDLKTVKAGYGATQTGYTSIFINFEFDKEGTQKFKDITNTYVETVVEAEKTEETETTEGTEQTTEGEMQSTEPRTVAKEITIKIDDQELLSTHFDTEISNGILQLSFGSNQTLTAEEMQKRLVEASNMAILLNSGKMPVEYEVVQNRYMHSDITMEQINLVVYTSIALVTIGIIYLVIRYRMLGIKSAISFIGYIALYLIAIRIFNVEVSIAGIFAIILSVILAFTVIASTLRRSKKEENIRVALSKTLLKYSLVLAPVCIIAIVLTITNISMGAVLFWGIVINILYNLTVTRVLLINKK